VLSALDDTHFMGLHNLASPDQGEAQVFELTAAGQVVEGGRLGLWQDSRSRAFQLGSALYVCNAGHLKTFDVSELTAPKLTSDLPFSWCALEGLMPRERQLLASLGDGAPTVFDLSSPLAPARRLQLALPTQNLTGVVAGAAALVTAYANDPCCYGWTRLELRDPEKFELKGSIDFPLRSRRSVGLALEGDSLLTIVLHDDHTVYTLTRYSLTDLSNPVKTGEFDVWGGPEVVVAGGGTAVVPSGGPKAFRLGASISYLDGTQLGPLSDVVDHEGVFALSASGVRAVDFDAQGRPLLLRGSSVGMPGSFVLVGSQQPVAVTARDNPYVSGRAGVLDASDPSHVRVVQGNELTGSGTGRFAWVHGDALYSMRGSTVLERYAAAELWGAPRQPALVASATLSSPMSQSMYAFSSHRVAVVGYSSALQRSGFTLFDDGETLRELGTFTMSSSEYWLQLRAMAVYENLVLVVTSARGLRLYEVDDAQRAVTLRLSNQSWTEVQGILELGARSAVLATTAGVRFVDFDSTGFTIKGELPLPQVPRSMVRSHGRLVLGANSSVSVVAPPCPVE
jgi:hypothetical protein